MHRIPCCGKHDPPSYRPARLRHHRRLSTYACISRLSSGIQQLRRRRYHVQPRCARPAAQCIRFYPLDHLDLETGAAQVELRRSAATHRRRGAGPAFGRARVSSLHQCPVASDDDEQPRLTLGLPQGCRRICISEPPDRSRLRRSSAQKAAAQAVVATAASPAPWRPRSSVIQHPASDA